MHAETATDTDIAFVPATFELLPMLTVAENVALRTLRRIAAELGIAVVLTADDAA